MANLELRGVVKRFGAVEVIHGVDLTIEDGEFTVFVGPSGCGKSTLLRMIAGLEAVSGGEVYIGDELVNDVAAAKRGLAMVFQSYALFRICRCARTCPSAWRRWAHRRRRSPSAWRRPPRSCRSTNCSSAAPASCPAASGSAWLSVAPSCASPGFSCSTSRSAISMPSSGCRCASRSTSCTAGWARP